MLHSLRTWMKKSLTSAGRPTRRPKHNRARAFQPELERLEERTLLSADMFLEHLNSGVYVNAYQGVGFTRNQVATLAGPTGLTSSNTPIQINWGDGKTSAGELADVGSNGIGSEIYQVKGSHVFQQLASGTQITVTVVGQVPATETAEAYVVGMPSGLQGTPPPNAKPTGNPADVYVQLQHLNSGVYVNTQVGDTTPVKVGSFFASLNGQPDLTANPQSQFTAYVNWGNSSSWTKAQLVYQGASSGGYDIIASPPPYAKPTPDGQMMPIIVYLTGPDGTSTSTETAEAIVTPGSLANTVKAELQQILPSSPTPVVTQSGNVMTVKWGGLTISNDVSTAAPGAAGRESPGDVKTFVDMVQDAVSRSPSLQNSLQHIVNDTGHPVTVLVGNFIGRSSTGDPVFLDEFDTKLVDVGQLGQLPTSLPADQGVTQGEIIAHLLGERYYAATHPGSDFATDHILGGVKAQNDYRTDLGATLMVETATFATPGPGFQAAGQYLYTGGLRQVLQLDPNMNVQVGPVSTTPLPSNLPTVANALTHSAELYADFITHSYQKYLGRKPDAAGLASWVQAMQNGLSDEHLEAGLIGSAEYIANHGGAGAGWVIGMYKDLLGRTPAQAEVNEWVNALEHGVSTQQVAYGFAASAERESLRVQNDYLTFLGRSASSSEVSAWVNAFLHGYSNEDVVAGFVGSLERFQQAGNDIPTWIDNAYLSILGHHADSDARDAWAAVLAQGLPST
jgi:hypothetical protein